jgi:phospholipid N-methyltransferase
MRALSMDGGERRGQWDSGGSVRVEFCKAWIANPLRVAAVAPSSPSLARLITADIRPGDGPVLELGPGTGVFTSALLSRGLREHDLTLVEAGETFARELGRKFPRARVLCMDAAHLAQGGPLAGSPFGTAISGLPLLSMPRRKIQEILAGVFAVLKPAGALYQFTYTPWCPVPRPVLDQMGLRARLVGHAVRNLPPASVYRIVRRPAAWRTGTAGD